MPVLNTTILYSSNDDKLISATIYYTNELFHTTISNLSEVYENKKSLPSALFKVELRNLSAQFLVVSYDYLVKVLKPFLETTPYLFACKEMQEKGLVGYFQEDFFIWLDTKLTATSYIMYSNEAMYRFEKEYRSFYEDYKKIIQTPRYISETFNCKDLDLGRLKQYRYPILNLTENLTIC